jgi:nuclear pore complex protein Nup98-Nup96
MREQRPRLEQSPAQSPASRLFNPSNGSSRIVESSRPGAGAGAGAASPAVSAQEPAPKEGDYWCKPRLEKLRHMSRHELRDVSNFTAGRVGYGEVTFEEPVDLTGVDLDTFLGSVIVFTDMELAVYPDDGPDKPARGAGLNMPARITLENVFPKDKATKQNITDASDPRHAKFLRRVKSIPDTEFVSYTDDGVWTFTVEHFSRYGLRDDSDEEEEDVVRHEKRGVHDEGEDDMPPTKSIRDIDGETSFEDDGEMKGDETSDSASHSGSGSASGSAADETMTDAHDTDDEGSDKENWAEPIKSKVGQQGWDKVKSMQAGQFVPAASMDLDVGAMKRKAAMAAQARVHLKRSVGPDFESAEEGRNARDARVVKVGHAMRSVMSGWVRELTK